MEDKKKNLITPMDINKKEFTPRGKKGFDRYEVDSFLDQIVKDYGDVLDQMVDLKNRVSALQNENSQLKKELNHYEQVKDSLNDSLISAQQTADEIKRNAQQKAQEIVSQAQKEADEQTKNLQTQRDTLKQDYDRLKVKVEDFREQIAHMLEVQTKELQSDDWQYYLDKYYQTERMYPADGSQPIPVSDVEESAGEDNEFDNDGQFDVNFSADSVAPDAAVMTGDTPVSEQVTSETPEMPAEDGTMIIFPDDYKDHN